MAEPPKKSKFELAIDNADATWQQQFLRMLSLTSLLRESIINSDYRISDDMNNAITLTKYGADIAQTLTKKHDVPYKEAKMMCFLLLAYRDLLVDIEKTNYPVLVDEIGRQIREGTIRHPFVHGRILYDKAAELFSDEHKYLSVSDTSKLLDGTPCGVWQTGELITGPYGLIKSREERQLVPSTYIPLQHCSDPSCDRLHYVQLTTDYEAPVNFHRPKLNRLLEQGGREPSDWNGFIEDMTNVDSLATKADDLHTAGLVFLLGDGLSDDELAVLFCELLDNTGGVLRSIAAEQKMRGSSEDIARGLGRAHMLQLILHLTDTDIVRVLDRLVQDQRIAVPPGEVRRPRVNLATMYGRWGLISELGQRGVRFRAWNNASLPMLRLRRLIDGMYDSNLVEDMQSLDWQLRSIDAMTPAAKLAEFLRIESPESALETLVLARRQNVEKACTSLGVPFSIETSDDELTSSLLWKLGFRSRDSNPPHGRFSVRHEEIIRLARAAQLSSTVDEEPIRRAAGVYFEDLEALLSDSLGYATWALMNDHYSSERPYVFRPLIDVPLAMQTLSKASEDQAQKEDRSDLVTFSDLNTIYPLCRGFTILASLLDTTRENSVGKKRPTSQYPEYTQNTDLQQFPFVHVHPFLDLRTSAQVAIVEGLRQISLELLSHDVTEIRNSLSHFRRTTVEITKVISGLEAVGRAVQQVSDLGFLRIPYHHLITTIDEWGRRTITLTSPEDQRVSFTRPSAFDWLGMPSLNQEQYLMLAALYAEPNEVLRFRLGYSSPYEEMWTNYPSRRAAKGSAIGNQSETGVADVDAVGRSSTRAG